MGTALYEKIAQKADVLAFLTVPLSPTGRGLRSLGAPCGEHRRSWVRGLNVAYPRTALHPHPTAPSEQARKASYPSPTKEKAKSR